MVCGFSGWGLGGSDFFVVSHFSVDIFLAPFGALRVRVGR